MMQFIVTRMRHKKRKIKSFPCPNERDNKYAILALGDKMCNNECCCTNTSYYYKKDLYS